MMMTIQLYVTGAIDCVFAWGMYLLYYFLL